MHMADAGVEPMVVSDDHRHRPLQRGFAVGIEFVALPCPPPNLTRMLRLGDDLNQRKEVAHSGTPTYTQNARRSAESHDALRRWELLCGEVPE